MIDDSNILLVELLSKISKCSYCSGLPLGPRPVLSAESSAKILIIGQAPGTKVHATGVPWDDPSGDRLRAWMGINKSQFYDTSRIAIVPMGFCYPGRGKSGDLPPRPECAPKWHSQVLAQLPNIELTLLIGQYAQSYYLNDHFKTLTERVKNWEFFIPDGVLPLVHPSPRNQGWLQKNPWFEREFVPFLKSKIKLNQ